MKKSIYLILLLSLLLALSGCGNGKVTQYREDTENVVEKVLSNSAKVENVIDSYSSIWNYSIKKRSPIPISEMASFTGLTEQEIKEYFQLNGANNVPNDFSANIYSLKSYYNNKGVITEIESASTEIKNIVSTLKSPPKGFEDAYNEVLDLYSLSEEYVAMVTNPSGSLKEFNENANRLSSEILTKYKRIEVVMPGE